MIRSADRRSTIDDRRISPRAAPARSPSRGFTLIEMIVSTAIMLVVMGAVLELITPVHGMFQAQPEISDMQQRLRVAADMIYRDLVMAGAGGHAAEADPLGYHVASILPFRRGARDADPPASFFSDRISVLYVPASPAETRVSAAMSDPQMDIPVEPQRACPGHDPLCGFTINMMVAIFDETGAVDTFRITGIVDSPPALQHAGQPLSKSYGIGAFVFQVVTATYWLKTDPHAQTYQLMNYDGYHTDLPLIEHVVGLNFEYYGDPLPPVLRKPLSDARGPWTSYGPKPPEVDVDDPSTPSYAAGENCVFTVDEGKTVGRLELEPVRSSGQSLVRLDRSRLIDGPWCPDPTARHRYDADLLRVRKIRVTIRIQVGLETLRGTGTLFARPGTSRGGERFVPDQEIRFDVAPRNVNPGR
jgi:prepilin-type N-terminal cleavage/methylation domain-containing protein